MELKYSDRLSVGAQQTKYCYMIIRTVRAVQKVVLMESETIMRKVVSGVEEPD